MKMGTALKEFKLQSPALDVRLPTALQVLQVQEFNLLAQHWARDWRALALKELFAGPLDRSDRAAKVKQKARCC